MARVIMAVVLSFLCPGLGQYYNRDYRKGSWILVVTSLLVLLPSVWMVKKIVPLMPDLKKETASQEMFQSAALKAISENRHLLNFISFAFLGVWAYAITQAYFKAKEISDKETPKPEGPWSPS